MIPGWMRPRRRQARHAYVGVAAVPAVATVPAEPTLVVAAPAAEDVDHAALARQVAEVTEELDESRRARAVLTTRVLKLRARLAMSPSEAHRNNLLLSEQMEELRSTIDRLEAENRWLRSTALVLGVELERVP